MPPTQPQKNNKILLSFFVLLLFFGVGIFVLSNGNKDDTDSANLYTKKIEIGNTTLNLVVKTITLSSEDGRDWLSGEYRFYSIGENPALLAKVESGITPEYNKKTGVDPLFFLKDITGDGVPEIFVLVERSASNLREYEILHLDNNELLNIKLESQKDNWVDFDQINYYKSYISLDWHGPTSDYKIGRNYYSLEKNVLKFYKGVIFKITNDSITKQMGETCDVSVMNKGESNYKFIENIPCRSGQIDFEVYFNNKTRLVSDQEKDIRNALTEEKLYDLAKTYYMNYCDIDTKNNLLFRDIIENLKPIKKDEVNGEVYLVPCLTDWINTYIVTTYNGVSYTPITPPRVDMEGRVFNSWESDNISYNAYRDIFISEDNNSHGAGCRQIVEYKLEYNELVVQRSVVDGVCDEKTYVNQLIYEK